MMTEKHPMSEELRKLAASPMNLKAKAPIADRILAMEAALRRAATALDAMVEDERNWKALYHELKNERDELRRQLAQYKSCLESDGGECYGWKLANERAERAEARAKRYQEIIDGFYDAIAHGDDEHRKWLRETVDAYLREPEEKTDE